MAASWLRFDLRINDDVGLLFRLGRTLADAGLIQPGVSIWFSRHSWRRHSAAPTHPRRPSAETVEIYLSPAAATWLAAALVEAGCSPQACEEPNRKELELLIGDAAGERGTGPS